MTSIPEDVKTLAPCPFCGSSAHIERRGDRRQSTIYQCDNCSCTLETGEEWGHGREWNRRAILTDREARSVIPAGYKLVPVEPTPEMQNAGAVIVQSWDLAGRLYSSMLAAYPSPSREETEGYVGLKGAAQIASADLASVVNVQVTKPDVSALLLEAEKALERIVQWSEAYPLSAFPEPDLKRARELLEAGGMTLDAISASNMRHVINGAAKIASSTLAKIKGE